MLSTYGLVKFHITTIHGHTGLCATRQWARSTVVPTPPKDPTSGGSSNNGWCGDPELWGTDTPFVQSTTRGTTDDTDSILQLRGTEPPYKQHVVSGVLLGRVTLPPRVRERVGSASVSSLGVRRCGLIGVRPCGLWTLAVWRCLIHASSR